MDEILCKEVRNTVQALIKDKKRRLLLDKLSEKYRKIKKALENYKTMGLPDKKAPTTSISLNTKKELISSPRATAFKKKLRIFQEILLKSFLNLQENLECLECASITKKLTSVKKDLKLKKLVQCRFWNY